MLSSYFEDFSAPSATISRPGAIEMTEELRLEVFEEGYKAGWDDAFAAKQEQGQSFDAEFQQNLSDMSFTYHEAVAHATKQASAIMKEVLDKIMPAITRGALEDRVMAIVSEKLREAVGGNIEVLVHSDKAELMESLVNKFEDAQVTVLGSDGLSENAAEVRMGGELTIFDVDDTVRDVVDLVNDYWAESETMHKEAV